MYIGKHFDNFATSTFFLSPNFFVIISNDDVGVPEQKYGVCILVAQPTHVDVTIIAFLKTNF